MARKGKAPTVQSVAEAAAAQAVKEVIPSILKAVAAEVARAVEPAVVAAVQASIRAAVQAAVAGVTGGAGGAPVVSFGTPLPAAAPRVETHKVAVEAPVESEGVPQAVEETPVPLTRPKDPNSPEGRAWLANQMSRSNSFGEKQAAREKAKDARPPARTGNAVIDRMLIGGIQAAKTSDFT